MNPSNLSISGFSTALFSTWFFIDELGVLFDAGDGLTAGLLQKSRKIKHVFISHADRDHLGGLFQFNQLNARDGFPIIHYPESSGSFPAIKKFTTLFDPHSKGTVWVPIKANHSVKIKERIFVESFKNNHIIAADHLTKSLSYKIKLMNTKLKQEFSHLTGSEIGKLAKEKGKDFISETSSKCLFGYSGDTPIEEDNRWDNTQVLIHEATFLNHEDGKKNHANKHSNLEEVLKMVANLNIEKLILSHFSSRYSQEQIDEAIIKYCKEFKIQIPVFRILPGETNYNILASEPIN